MQSMQCKMLLWIGLLAPACVMGADSFYCPKNQGYINVGMTPEQVLAACGPPTSKATNQPVTQTVPVEQRIYQSIPTAGTVAGQTMMYQMYSLPQAGNMGPQASLQVDIINDKVADVHINGNSTNATTLCGGVSIKIGDPASSVNGACGDPTFVNQSYITQVVPITQRPEVWMYQVDQYQSSIRLTFIDGKLQSIEQ